LCGETPDSATYERGQSVYVSLDCYESKGDGALSRFVDNWDIPLSPSGFLYGATVGYVINNVAEGEMSFELTVLKGTPDDSSLSKSSDTVETVTRKNDIDMARLVFEYSPNAIKFLFFGAEIGKMNSDTNLRYAYTDADSNYMTGTISFGYISYNVLATVALRDSDLYLFKGEVDSLAIVPCAKIGAGYAMRDSDKGYSYDYYYPSDDYSYSGYINFSDIDDKMADDMPDDAPIYTCDASLDLVYISGGYSASALAGFRLDGDIDERSNQSYGMYGKIEFRYTW